jgi:hypothetical protein
MNFTAIVTWIANSWQPHSRDGRLKSRHDFDTTNNWLLLVPAATLADTLGG